MPVATILVRHSVFPTSPSQPRTGISIDLLEIYRALFERSCDAITTLAAALHTIYDRRGFRVTSTKNPPLTPGRADRILRERCPACFGLDAWGRPLREGGDVQLGADGCFSYRHLRSAGDGPISYDPSYFVPKAEVENIRARILQARKKRPAPCTPLIPQEAIDACESSWDAANEKKQKADPKRHDSSGVFIITCRHSQVLFLCDITTPGEQQQYVVSLMEKVVSHLPPEATVVQAYDVGCVTDHSLNLFPILSEGLRERVSFVINAMHAFGHQWVCQLVYSPRLRRGLGLTDAEGVERFWSRIRKLIGITRSQWAAFVNDEGRINLGTWIERQQVKNLATKRKATFKILKDCGVPEADLRRNWEDKKVAQTSLRSRHFATQR
ncbi:hypothetical protein C8R44DRAFT_834429 [Mycena epipterygia]|nr:hypothetical protein C8R44DRAFT_834429 [Mycena epipterygia]